MSRVAEAAELNTHAAVTPIRVGSLLAGEERLPVYVHIVEHPEGRILVDTGMTRLHPAVADMDPQLNPLNEQDLDLNTITAVANTHLHFDHCGGNHLFTGPPVYVQRQELEDARTKDDYTIREWVDASRVNYVPVDGELELFPGDPAGPGARPHARLTDRRHRNWPTSDRDRRRHRGVVR